MFNPVLNENTYSHILIGFFKGYNASQGVSHEEIDTSAHDLHALGPSGDYFFSSNEYIMMGINRKPRLDAQPKRPQAVTATYTKAFLKPQTI